MALLPAAGAPKVAAAVVAAAVLTVVVTCVALQRLGRPGAGGTWAPCLQLRGVNTTALAEGPQQEEVLSPAVENIYVLRAAPHEWNDIAQARLRQMRRQLGSDWVFLLVDDTKLAGLVNGSRLAGGRWAPGSPQTLVVSEADCRAASPLHRTLYDQPHTAMALLAPYLEPVQYKYLWMVEWDVKCHGNWTECLRLPAEYEGMDLVAVYMARQDSGVGWNRWGELEGAITEVPWHLRWKSFFPVARFSKGFLGQMLADLASSSGFCEAYVPTLCGSRLPNCTLRSFPEQNLGQFGYVWNDPGHRCAYPPEPDNKLYHPCKGNLR